MSGVFFREVGLRLGSEAELSPDPLHVDAEDARALAAPEGGDGQAREVAQSVVGPVAERGGDLLSERVEVDVRGRVAALGWRLRDAFARGLGLGSTEEEPVE